MPFENIFSKKKVEEKKIKIIVDNREKNSLVASELMKLGLEVEFKNLLVADYLVKDTAIERKTINDLKSSIINRRIFAQLKEIKQYPKNLLLVEGILDQDLYSGIIHENAFRGFLISATVDNQTPIIFTQNAQDTAKYISVLAKRKENSSQSLRASKSFLTKEERIKFILEGFPGIGPKTADKLLEKFKSLKNIINASEDELKEILGKKTEGFKELLD